MSPTARIPRCRGKAVSWGAIIGGAVAATAVTMIFAALGSAFGLSAASPYGDNHIAALSVGAGIWIIVVQWLSSGLGGYMAGRLRNGYEGLHGDEVFFRDTAHGLLSWAVATIFVAGLFVSAMGAMTSGGMKMAGAGMMMDQHRPAAMGRMHANDIVNDMLRSDTKPAAGPAVLTAKRDALRLMMSKGNEDLTPADKDRLTQIVAAQTGLSSDEAAARVDQAQTSLHSDLANVKDAADDARKAAAKVSFLTGLSMLIGAFIAGVAGAIGGRHRDEY